MKKTIRLLDNLLSLSLIITFSCFGFQLFSYNVEAGPFTTVEISVISPPNTIDVSPEATGMTLGTFTVNCTTYNTITPVTVQLSAEMNHGNATIDSSQITLQGSEMSDDFEVMIKVPLKSRVQTLDLKISGTWEQGPWTGSVEPVHCDVQIAPYYDFEIQAENTTLEVNPGESAISYLTITNTGNEEDSYSIECSNSETLAIYDIRAPDFQSVTVSPNSSIEVALKFIANDSTPICQIPVKFNITSDGSKGNLMKTHILLLEVVKREEVMEGGVLDIVSKNIPSSYYTLIISILLLSYILPLKILVKKFKNKRKMRSAS